MNISDTDYDQNSVADEAPSSRQHSILTLPLLFAVGWIIYEVTHQPTIAAMAMCLKFGWEDFRTARWLYRTDPDPGRGRACCWLYLASGLWQTAVIGVAMVIITVVLEEIVQFNQQGGNVDIYKLLAGAGFSIMFGFMFSTLATYIFLISCWRNRVRPWLNGAVHIARRKGEWPPLYGHRNRALVPVISTVIITCFVLVPVFLLTLSFMFRAAPLGNILRGLAALGSVCCVFLLFPASIVILQNLRSRRFFADHPADCWGEEPLTPAIERGVESEIA